MNPLLLHKSIRKYTKQPIDAQFLNEIIGCGIRASNTGNMQLYSVVVTQDTQKKEQLAKFHFGQKMVQEAAAVLTICADVNRFHKWCELHNEGKAYDNFLWFYTASIDAVIATQNICVAAEAKGLGICYLGTVNYNAPEIGEFLNLPEGVVPVTCITMGYPAENPEQTDRLPLEGVVHFEKYNDYSAQDIEKIHFERENSAESRKFIEINQVENLAQIFTQKRYPKEMNKNISEKLLEYLQEQGFLK